MNAAHVSSSTAPILDGVRELIADDVVPGGTKRNLEAIGAYTTWDEDVDDGDRLLLADAQTSGGLLIAVTPARADALVAALERENAPAAARIGEVVEGKPGWIDVMA